MENFNKKISQNLLDEYKTFLQSHGASAKGLGWNNDYSCRIRYNRMLKVIDDLYENQEISILDVGCGFGDLYGYAVERNLNINYAGIDINENAIKIAQDKLKDTEFFCGDFLNFDFNKSYDYVVCNGILTFKSSATRFEMEAYAKNIILKMYDLCNIGIAFNVLTTHVDNFSNHNFYQSPLEMMAYCMQNITTNIKIDHSYRFSDYTIYLYKNCENRLNMEV